VCEKLHLARLGVIAITVLSNQQSNFYSGKGRNPSLFSRRNRETDMRKHIPLALAALVFAFSLILFAAFNANETTASNTRQARAGPQYGVPVNLFLGVKQLDPVW
jgi:hypothetical protein